MKFYKLISYFAFSLEDIKCIDTQIMTNPNISTTPPSNMPNNVPPNIQNKNTEKVPTHVLDDTPPLKFCKEGLKKIGYFLHPDTPASGIPKLSINPQCEIVKINGVESQLCPNALYNNLLKNNNDDTNNISNQLTNNLSELFRGSPDVSENLKKVIMSDDKLQLWNQITDIDSKQQHQLPQPKGLFNRARDKLNILTTVKESLSQELLTTEKLVKRVKSYLDENRETLQRNLPIMREILQKLPSVHDTVMQNDLAQRYVRLHKEEMEVLELYNTEKDWLVEVLTLFGSLFALT